MLKVAIAMLPMMEIGGGAWQCLAVTSASTWLGCRCNLGMTTNHYFAWSVFSVHCPAHRSISINHLYDKEFDKPYADKSKCRILNSG